jgi:DNA-directed RNA polymerase subunit RPC12/RpoP
MTYFINCDRCGSEVRVSPLETHQHRAQTCKNCGAELVFANSELKELRLAIVIRCPNVGCPAHGKMQWVPLTRTFLKQTFEPGGDDRVMCPHCRELFKFSPLEKQNIRKMLEEEAGQEATL